MRLRDITIDIISMIIITIIIMNTFLQDLG